MNIILQGAAIVAAIGTIGGGAYYLDERHASRKEFTEFVADYKRYNAKREMRAIIGRIRREIPGARIDYRSGSVDCNRAGQQMNYCLYLRDQLRDAKEDASRK